MIRKNDFIELEFVGREVNGPVFDTNIPEEAKELGINVENKPFIICVGQKMVIGGLDKALEGKEIDKQYTIVLSAKEAFGDRRKEMVKLIPLKSFTEKNVAPQAGMTLSLDNHLVRIASVSGGRVLVDFNNPLSGKEITYEFKIKKQITDVSEKLKSLLNYFLKQELDFKIEGKKAVFSNKNPIAEPAVAMLNDKFKDVLGIELIVDKKEGQ